MMSRVIGESHCKRRIKLASSLGSARKALSQNAVSSILLDNNLPDGNGANFAVELSLDPDFCCIPVIMVSD